MWCKGTCDVFLIIKIIFLKEQFTQNPSMLMDSQVNFVSPQNISGASQKDGVASFSETTEVAGNLFYNRKTSNE